MGYPPVHIKDMVYCLLWPNKSPEKKKGRLENY
jgi:hypothetical protein